MSERDRKRQAGPLLWWEKSRAPLLLPAQRLASPGKETEARREPGGEASRAGRAAPRGPRSAPSAGLPGRLARCTRAGRAAMGPLRRPARLPEAAVVPTGSRTPAGTSAPGPSEPPDAAPRRTAGAGPRPTQLGSGVHRRPRVRGPGARTRSCCLVPSTQLPDDRTTSFKKSNSVPRFVTNRGCHCGPSHLRLLLPSIASSSLLILLFF